MRNTFCILLLSVIPFIGLQAGNENDSLLRVLDKVIAERQQYTEKKQGIIRELKIKKAERHTLDEQYQLNAEIISQYETFICDSAEQYIHKNIRIAEEKGIRIICWKVNCIWHLYIPCRDCLCRQMIYSSQSDATVCPDICRLCIAGTVSATTRILSIIRTMSVSQVTISAKKRRIGTPL